MSGHRNFAALRGDLDKRLDERPDGQEIRDQAAAKLSRELDAHERSLRDLRRARALTQTQLGRALDVSQAQVSRIESQTDLYLSTLESYLGAMGGHLELVGVFDDVRVPLSLGAVARESPAE